MGKAKRLKSKRKRLGGGLCAQISDHLTENFQRELRKSELWDEIVAECGEERAEEILRECQADVRPGAAADGSRDRTGNIP